MKMLHNELRRVCEEINKKEETMLADEIREMQQTVIDEVVYMLQLVNTVETEGALALDEEIYNLGDQKKGLQKVIKMITNGFFEEDIIDVAWREYTSKGLSDYSALIFLLWIESVKALSNSENKWLYEEKILSLLPENIEKEYLKQKEDEDKRREEENSQEMSKLAMENVSVIEIIELSPRKVLQKFYLMELLNEVFQNLSEESMHKVLRDIEFYNLAMLFHGLSTQSKSNIFNGICSNGLAVRITEYYKEVKQVSNHVVLQVAQKVLKTICVLMCLGEIENIKLDEIKVFLDDIGIDYNYKLKLIAMESKRQGDLLDWPSLFGGIKNEN